ncbi:MAG TPA: SDR family oxidoreductase, partial [Candidatus Limnocylindria bacterium]
MPRAAIVTGGSRGIGAATCISLAARGYDVAFTYRNKAARAADVAAEAERAGVRALAVRADITVAQDVARLGAELTAWTDALDLIVLNASGGLERDIIAQDPDYPMRINRDAQLAVVDALLPLLHPPATIVHVTSHWAHRYGAVRQLPAYEPVARSKHAGEEALRARVADLGIHGVRLLVVTGDLVEGTITARLLERASPGLAATRAGVAITPRAVAEAIVGAAGDRRLASGATVVVGGALEALERG